MAKKKKKIDRGKLNNQNKGVIKAQKVEDDFIIFSFKYLDSNDSDFQFNRQQAAYYVSIIDRLKNICCIKTSEFTSIQGRRSLRIHRINWGDTNVTKNGFGIPQRTELDDDAWQFSISVNAHGRVHGALVDNILFIRWLDPDHNLFE